MNIKSIFLKSINFPGTNPGIWNYGMNFSVERLKHASSVDNLGNIYISGGSNTSVLSSVEKYNIGTNSWTSVSSLNEARHRHSMTYDNFNNVYVFGGSAIMDLTTNTLDTVEKYDANTDSWDYVTSMLSPRKNFSVCTNTNGLIYIIGGTDQNNNLINTIDEYSPNFDAWTTKTTLPYNLTLTSANIYNNKIYIYGGDNNTSDPPLASMIVYDLINDTWDLTKDSMNSERIAFGGGKISNELYAIGGYDGSNVLSSVEKYIITNNQWNYVSSLLTARYFHSSVSYNNKIYVFGGFDSNNILNSMEIFTI